MYIPNIIKKKRDGKKLNNKEFEYLIKEYVRENIPDYQMSALLMAAFINGLDNKETFYLTQSMLNSGDVYNFDNINGIKVDKHSTGGVGDKISIHLAPLLASLGFYVPMVSGRGLGHTGGTLDKLESIKNFNVNLSATKFRKILEKNRVVMAGQTNKFVPADKKLYALRDVTGTVESIPLITASIMSKKMAEGIDSLLLDIKCGNGAFMKTKKDAQILGDSMYNIGRFFKKKITYIISDMSQVLGDCAGNGIEILESIEILKNKNKNSAYKLMVEMAKFLLLENKFCKNEKEAYNKIYYSLEKGYAYEKFLNMIRIQEGDIKSLNKKYLLSDKYIEIKANKKGFLKTMDTYNIGIALIYLNAGRFKKEDKINHKTGIRIHKHIGDKINKGDIIFTVYYSENSDIAIKILKDVYEISDKPIKEKNLILYKRGI